jgi:hypothetical protein
MADEKNPDSVAASSTAVVEVPEVVDEEFTPPEDLKDEKSKARFQKLVDRAKAAEGKLAGYADYGDPEKIQEYVEYTRSLETSQEQMRSRIAQLEARRDPGEPKTDEQKTLEATRDHVRKQIREAEPVIDRLEKKLERDEQREQADTRAVLEDAFEATRELMTIGGAKPTDRDVNRRGKIYEAIISDDPSLAIRFKRNPEKVIRKAHDIYLRESRSVAEQEVRAESQRGKERSAGLPRAHGGGGGPGATKPTEPVKSIADGLARGMARMRERG